MKILIVGGGSVGFITAEYFKKEGHDVRVVEQRSVCVTALRERLKLPVVKGKGTDIMALRAAQIEDTDVFMALTDDDEVNIIACTLAKASDVKRRIARINDQSFLYKENALSLRELGVEETVDTEQTIVEDILKMVEHPGVTDVKYFLDGQLFMGTFSFNKKSAYYGQPLRNIKFPFPIYAFGYMKVSYFMPFDPDIIVNEFLYVTYGVEKKYLKEFYEILFPGQSKVKNVMIFGSGYKSRDSGCLLAKKLLKKGVETVTVVEENAGEAAYISEKNKFPVISADMAKPHMTGLHKETATDMFIAISDNFEKNLLSCSLAEREGVPFTVSMIKYPEYMRLLSTMPVTAFVNPALATANRIMRYHRPDEIITRTIINYGRAECLEILVTEKSKIAEKTVGEINIGANSEIVAIKRGGRLQNFEEDFLIIPNDQVLFFLHESDKGVLKNIL